MSKDTRLPCLDMLVCCVGCEEQLRGACQEGLPRRTATEWWMARDQVLLPAASMACKAPARPKGSAGEMGSSRARRCSRGSC